MCKYTYIYVYTSLHRENCSSVKIAEERKRPSIKKSIIYTREKKMGEEKKI